ncbi:MAG: hypothetical protein AB8G86_07730 [Saprospiraceae bacterium]
MAQKEMTYNFSIKRLVGQVSTSRFIFGQIIAVFIVVLFFGGSACGEPEIKLDRAARRTIDTLVNYQLDSISPILDSLCKNTRGDFIQQAVDSIVEERKKKEERLRLNDE